MSRLFTASPARIIAVAVLALAASAGCGTSTPPPAPGANATVDPSTDPAPTGTETTGTGGSEGTSGGNSGGSGGSGSGGSGGSGTSSWPSPEDCVSYNPGNLAVSYADGRYTVQDGSKVVLRVPGQTGDNTGAKALALAKRYKKHCYLGRTNDREERNSYIFDYWRDASGQTPTIADQEDDCSSYNRNNLTVEDMGGGDGWRVKDHDHVLHLFDNGTDARNGKLVLAKYNQICFIGNGGDDNNGQDQISYSR